MSIDFTVLCKRALPSDWAPQFRADGFPFHFWIGDIHDWRVQAREWIEQDAQLATRLEDEWSFVAHFNCRPMAAQLVELCAQELVNCFGGFFFDDHSEELSDIASGRSDCTGADVIAAWRRLVDDEQAQEKRSREHAIDEFNKAAAEDPDAYAEANDWSDV